MSLRRRPALRVDTDRANIMTAPRYAGVSVEDLMAEERHAHYNPGSEKGRFIDVRLGGKKKAKRAGSVGTKGKKKPAKRVGSVSTKGKKKPAKRSGSVSTKGKKKPVKKAGSVKKPKSVKKTGKGKK